MTWIFIVGIEGSGHHAMFDILSDAPGISTDRRIDKLLADRWRNFSRASKTWQRIFRYEEELFENGFTHYLYTTSFPFDQPRESIRRPDILDIARHVGVRLKMVVMQRDLIECVGSAVRRNFTSNELEQASIAGDNARYIQSVLPGMDYRWIDYEHLLNMPVAVCNSLAEYIGLSFIDSSRIRQPSRHLVVEDIKGLLCGVNMLPNELNLA